MTRKSQAGSRRAARQLLLQALYQWQLTGHSRDELQAQFTASPQFAAVDAPYFSGLLTDILEDVAALDRQIGEHADRGLDQLDPIARAALLIGLAELKHRPQIPPKVVINESVDLAKTYGPSDAYRFVNALLDRVARGSQQSADE